MAIPAKLLSRDEVVVRHMHRHWKVLLWRYLSVLLMIIVATAATILLPDGDWRRWVVLAIWVLLVVVTIPVLLVPWIKWINETFTITTKRVITRKGVFNKIGHDLPLSRISDVQQERSMSDRFFHCGTLSLQTSADDPLLLDDIPDVQMVQVEISNLLFHDVQGAIDADPNA
ncbi:Bacterial membrane flanked domain [Actinomyces bovis]|uniref:Bacterial membrane flanked domain n=1 Tax=Actinomyces bovis TaxID=1658 RepID=A0ABY1VQ82_9ACTO|nr:PH domain-containing protein [Actinomyces bovis]SPT54281.1 Bacterial membrane flanked domain [Actinomyces bovis]VEG56392.1 Bacterial membrane flanked domain [Actinomyces israelii]